MPGTARRSRIRAGRATGGTAMIDGFRESRGLGAAGAFALALVVGAPALADEVGEVSTAFKLLGANHKIVVEAFDDPGVEGVSCFVSRAKTGGISGSLGLAEDTSDASIACRQTGPVALDRKSTRLNSSH